MVGREKAVVDWSTPEAGFCTTLKRAHVTLLQSAPFRSEDGLLLNRDWLVFGGGWSERLLGE